MKIKTNYAERPFLYSSEVPDSVLKSEFDWLDDGTTDHFLKYKGQYYHLSEFAVFSKDSDIPDYWHGFLGESAFSLKLIRVSGDGEHYQIATAFS